MRNGFGRNYSKDPSSNRGGTAVEFHVYDERETEPLEPEEARRILKEETPKLIKRLRNEVRELKDYLRQRGSASGQHWEEKAA